MLMLNSTLRGRGRAGSPGKARAGLRTRTAADFAQVWLVALSLALTSHSPPSLFALPFPSHTRKSHCRLSQTSHPPSVLAILSPDRSPAHGSRPAPRESHLAPLNHQGEANLIPRQLVAAPRASRMIRDLLSTRRALRAEPNVDKVGLRNGTDPRSAPVRLAIARSARLVNERESPRLASFCSR